MHPVRKLLIVAALLTLLALTGASAPSSSSLARVAGVAQLPRLTLWAWERPERLDDLGGVADRGIFHNVGVAFLAESIYLEDQPELHPRMQPLQVTPETTLTAVVRLENTSERPKLFSDEYRERVARLVAETARLPQVRAVQIDFDATRSQRAFYAALLRDVRRELPSQMPLSITALASWCLGDDWLSGLPIDEAVPMLFRMGIDRASIVSDLESGSDFRESLCRGSVGVSLDEPWPEPLLGRRVYVFAPRGWTPPTVAAVKRKLNP